MYGMQLLVDCGQASTSLQGQGVCRTIQGGGVMQETASRTAQVWEDCVGSTQRVRAQSGEPMLMGSTPHPLWEDGTGRLPHLL